MSATIQYDNGVQVRVTKDCWEYGMIGYVRSRLAKTSTYFVEFYSRDIGTRCYSADELEPV